MKAVIASFVLFFLFPGFIFAQSGDNDKNDRAEPVFKVKVSLNPVWMIGVGENIGSIVRYSHGDNGTEGNNYWFRVKPLSLGGWQKAAGLDFVFTKVFNNFNLN